MIFHLCRENISHKTDQFPMAFYSVDESHPRYQMMHHWHPETELLAVRRGTLLLSLDGTAVELTEGQSVLIPPGTVHNGTPKDCHYECVLFDGRAVTGILKGTAAKTAKHALSTPAVFGKDSPEAGFLQELTEALRRPEAGFELRTLGAVCGLLHQMVASPPARTVPVARRKPRLVPFEQAVLYLQEHFREQIALRDLAAAAGLSEKYFGEYFKNITGETPVQYLNEYRIEQAAEALKEDDKTVTEIALECGFNDLSYFIKTFRNHYGTAPGNYRKQQKNESQK